MYGIKVPLAVEDYVWVMDRNSDLLVHEPLLFKTKKEASNNAKIWGVMAVVEEYKEKELA